MLRRSSRPVKKISQDNDSQSSGEEDDEDGFEILTAENLFSTLLQRVSGNHNIFHMDEHFTFTFRIPIPGAHAHESHERQQRPDSRFSQSF